MVTVIPFLAPGYLLYFVRMMAPSVILLGCISRIVPTPVKDGDDKLAVIMVFSLINTISLALKYFLWFVFISESHYTLPSSFSQVIAILLCYLVCMIIGMAVAYTCGFICYAALGKPRNEALPWWMMVIIWSVTVVVHDILLSYTDMMATLLSFADYLVGMAALSCMVLALAGAAIQNAKIWRPELIHTSIVALTLLLLNMVWGSPFEKPSTDNPDLKSALVGYLIYIVCSMVLSYNSFGARLLLKTFVIGLTFVLLDMLVKPSSVLDTITKLFGHTSMIATTLMALFLLVALSFVVFLFLHTWAEILLPFPMVYNYSLLTFPSIAGLTFMVMKTMLGRLVEKPSIFSDMKAELHGIADMINDYQVACLVIRYLIGLSVPWLSMEFRRTTSVFKLYTKAAFILALGLVLTMPSTEKPASTMDLDYFLQRAITSIVTHTILIQITLIGGIGLYVLDIYHSWKQTLTKIGDGFIATPLLEAKIYIMDLVFLCSRGWCGKKIVNGSTHQADSRGRRR